MTVQHRFHPGQGQVSPSLRCFYHSGVRCQVSGVRQGQVSGVSITQVSGVSQSQVSQSLTLSPVILDVLLPPLWCYGRVQLLGKLDHASQLICLF